MSYFLGWKLLFSPVKEVVKMFCNPYRLVFQLLMELLHSELKN